MQKERGAHINWQEQERSSDDGWTIIAEYLEHV